MSHTPPAAADLAETAAEAIRDLNRVTRSMGGGLEYPGDAYTTVANLSALAMRLPQAFEQICGFIDRLDELGSLRSDNGPEDLAQRLEDLRSAMTLAGGWASALHTCLDQAHSALSPIGYAE